MEITLNNSFLAIEDDNLIMINGGITYSQFVIIAGVALAVFGVALLFPATAAFLGISAGLATKIGSVLTIMGLGTTLVSAIQNW